MSDTISDWVEQTLATLNPEEIPRFRGRLDWYVPLARCMPEEVCSSWNQLCEPSPLNP